MEEKEIKISSSFLNALFAMAALLLLVIVKICAHFGVASGAFYGIMSIFIYGLAATGLVLSYIKDKKLSPEFWFNSVVLIVALMCF